MENISRNDNIKKNLIDLLRIKTFLIYKQVNKHNDIYYDCNSANIDDENSIKITKFNTYDIVEIYLNSVKFVQIYYISTTIVKDVNIPNNENTYPEWIIYSYSETNIKDDKIKLPNYYSLNFLAVHYSTSLKQNNLRIELIDHSKYICYYNILTKDSNIKIVPNISDDTKEFNLFYHPNYYNEYNIYGYKYICSNSSVFKDSVYRLRKIKNNR